MIAPVSAEVLQRLFDVRGSRVVVTGAAAGLGFAMAEVLAECGARVTLADIHEERLEAKAAELAERGFDARGVVTDVRDEAAVDALVDGVVAEQGGVDVVFANAGLASVPGFRIDGGQTLAHARAHRLGRRARREPDRRDPHDAGGRRAR